MPSTFDLIALLLVVSALLGWLNHRYVRLPHATGLLVLALSLPDNPFRPLILSATYVVVLFTIVIQGTTLGHVARLTLARDD